MGFLQTVARLSCRQKVRTPPHLVELKVELLLFRIESNQWRWSDILSECTLVVFLWKIFSENIQLEGDPIGDLELNEGTEMSRLACEHLGIPQNELDLLPQQPNLKTTDRQTDLRHTALLCDIIGKPNDVSSDLRHCAAVVVFSGKILPSVVTVLIETGGFRFSSLLLMFVITQQALVLSLRASN